MHTNAIGKMQSACFRLNDGQTRIIFMACQLNAG